MFSPRQALLSAILCAALTAPSQASAPTPYENTFTNSTSLPQNLKAIADAKVYNEDYALMSLTIWPLQQVCQILAENGHASAITSLGQVSIHLASRLLRRMGAYDNPSTRHAIRVDLRKAINAREAHIASQTPKGEKEKKPMLEPWRELLGENASLQHLCWARQMLSPQNVEILEQEGLLEQLAAMTDNGLFDQLTVMKNKLKTLALGASAAQIFTEEMGEYDQACLIATAFLSALSPSEAAARATGCKKYLFTEKMTGPHQRHIIRGALASSCPVLDYAARIATCKQHLFTEDMEGIDQSWVIEEILPLSDTQLASLVAECKERPKDGGAERYVFIQMRAQALRKKN